MDQGFRDMFPGFILALNCLRWLFLALDLCHCSCHFFTLVNMVGFSEQGTWIGVGHAIINCHPALAGMTILYVISYTAHPLWQALGVCICLLHGMAVEEQ